MKNKVISTLLLGVIFVFFGVSTCLAEWVDIPSFSRISYDFKRTCNFRMSRAVGNSFGTLIDGYNAQNFIFDDIYFNQSMTSETYTLRAKLSFSQLQRLYGSFESVSYVNNGIYRTERNSLMIQSIMNSLDPILSGNQSEIQLVGTYGNSFGGLSKYARVLVSADHVILLKGGGKVKTTSYFNFKPNTFVLQQNCSVQ